MAKNYLSPKGKPIDGTLERLSGRAIINGIDDDGMPIYAGETIVWWEEQRTATKGGKIIYLDEDGDEFTFDELKEDPDSEVDE